MSNANRTLHLLLGLMIAGLVAGGCRSRITGNEGNFEFSYPTDDDFLDFNKPIAVGAFLDLAVSRVGGGTVGLTSASTEDESVLKVATFGSNVVTVEATGEGRTRIEVSGRTADGEELSDSVDMSAAVPEALEIAHTCNAGDDALYLTGTRFILPFELELSNGRPVIGYGYYPVSFSSDQLRLVAGSKSQAFMTLEAGATPGPVTIFSDIDATQLTATLVSPADVDGAELGSSISTTLQVGQSAWFYVVPTVGGQRVCQASLQKTVTSSDEAICTIYEVHTRTGTYEEYGWFQVTGKAEGQCVITVDYTDAGDGDGTTLPPFEIVP